MDSAQRGDGARSGMPVANDIALDGFPKYSHEPYYNEYTQTDLVVRPDTRSESGKPVFVRAVLTGCVHTIRRCLGRRGCAAWRMRWRG